MAGQTVEVSLGNPGPSATFQIPADVVPFVDSIYAEIDNSAGSDTTPTLEIRGPNGDTVAAVPQDAVVPGGDTGRATWALRLPGKRSSGAAGSTTAYARGFDNTGQVLPSGGSLEPGFATATTTDSSVLSWSTHTLTNDTLNLADGHVAILYASCGMNGGQANKDAFIYSPSVDPELAHDATIGLSFNAFIVPPGPQTGQPNFIDQTVFRANGSDVPLRYRMVSTDGVNRAVFRIYLVAIAFAV